TMRRDPPRSPSTPSRSPFSSRRRLLGRLARYLRRAGVARGKEDKSVDLTAIVTWIIFGAFVGVIARFLMPGRDSMGWIPTIVLGIVGSFVGGWLAQILFQGNA